MKVEKRNLLTIQDLLKFCQENKLYNFSSKEQGYKLKVQVPSSFEVDDNIDDTHRGMLKLKIRIFHTGLNRNGSFVSEEAAKEAMPTIKNRPVLAAIHQLDNGEWDFESHNFEIVTNEETGEEEINYIEKQVGSFDESEPFFEYDEELDKTYICSYAYIAEDYTKAADIIRAKNGTKNSVELSIDELSFNAKENYLSLDKFYVSASTLLGRRSDGTEIGEGMLGSRADIADFSEQNNTSQFDTNEELLNEIKKLNEKLTHFNINQAENSASENSKEGGNETVKFEELLTKYGKTVEDITFEYENLSDEELEAKFAEEFEGENTDGEGEDNQDDNQDDNQEPTSDGDEGENNSDDSDTNADNSDDDGEPSDDGVAEGEGEGNADDGEGEQDSEPEQFAEKLVRTYEVSHEDIRWALYNLLSAQEDADDEWYFINAVYDNHFTYESWSGEKIYGQSYTKEGDNIAFDGERWNLHRELLTDSEYAELMSMRSNYASLVQFKEDTENAQLHTQREAILYNEKYSVLAEKDENNEYKNEAFAKLVSEMDNYSLTDLEKELKSVFADYITNGGQFAYNGESEVKPVVNKKLFTDSANKSKKSSRYGNLFNK